MANNSSLPDYYERDFEYNEPEYIAGVSPSTNLKLYRDFRTLWAQRLFHDACDDYNSKKPEETSVHVREYPYHPAFPKAFAEYIGDELQLQDVNHKLETTYGSSLEKPDCDYLSDILEGIRHVAESPQNVERALKWLATKKEELPTWPPEYTEPDARGGKQRIIDSSDRKVSTKKGLGSKRSAIKNEYKLQPNQPPINPFDKLLLPKLPLTAFQQLLTDLELIGSDGKPTSKASVSAIKGFIFALQKHKCIKYNGSATAEALRSVYLLKISERSLQGSQGLSALNDEQKGMFRDTEDMLNKLFNKALGR